MSKDEQEWFVTERSRALAMIYLTRRDDLIVRKAAPGVGLEFIVSLSGEKGVSSPSVSLAFSSVGRKAP